MDGTKIILEYIAANRPGGIWLLAGGFISWFIFTIKNHARRANEKAGEAHSKPGQLPCDAHKNKMDEERTGRHELHAKVNSDISEIKTAIQYIKGSLEMIQQGLRNNNPYTRANSPTGITRDGHGLVERAGMDQMIDENRTRIKSTVLAKYIAACLNGNGADVNMTKVQKLTYIAYGTCLAVTGNRLADEHPQAWPYGPVFPAARSKLLKTDLNCIRLSDPDLQEISNDATVKSLVMLVCKSFGKWPAFALSEWSYKDGSPWERTVSSRGFKWGKEINDEYIRSYFRKIVVISDE